MRHLLHRLSRFFVQCLALLMALVAGAPAHAQTSPPLRIYVLDGGGAQFANAAAMSDTGEYDGRAATLANPCFLIRHPKGWLLWDTGLPLTWPAAQTRTFAAMGLQLRTPAPLAEQLKPLGLTPTDIGMLAFSHLHFDHAGQANSFPASQWILQREELAWAQAEPAHVSMSPELFSEWRQAKTTLIDGDHDVFGDGLVRILKVPGHTPGSSVLVVQLAGGPVILSGDLFLSAEGREQGLVPSVNADRAQTLASMQRVERLARNLGARVIVQHDPKVYESLPKPPAYLE
jgi:N-acyl homoserine lactone hydrolase